LFLEVVMVLMVYYGFEPDVEKFVTTTSRGPPTERISYFWRCLCLLKHLDSLVVHNDFYGKQSYVAQK
jgi:hypothetical protein